MSNIKTYCKIISLRHLSKKFFFLWYFAMQLTGFNKDIFTKQAVLEKSVRALYRCKTSATWSPSKQMQVGGSSDGNDCEYSTLSSWESEKSRGSLPFSQSFCLQLLISFLFLQVIEITHLIWSQKGYFLPNYVDLVWFCFTGWETRLPFLHYFNLKPNNFFPWSGLI